MELSEREKDFLMSLLKYSMRNQHVLEFEKEQKRNLVSIYAKLRTEQGQWRNVGATLSSLALFRVAPRRGINAGCKESP